MEREIWEIVKALDEKKLTAIEAHKKICDLYIVIRSRLSVGDKLICWAKGASYGDTFTIQDSMCEEGMILQSDKSGSCIPLKDVDLSEFDYA